MANTLTNILHKILARSLPILREQCIAVRTVNFNYSSEAAKKGTVINIPKPKTVAVQDVTPSNTPPAATGISHDLIQMTLDNWRENEPFALNDDELCMIDKNEHFLPDVIQEAVRGIANDMNQKTWANYKGVYGFVGTAGTTPFGAGRLDQDIIDARKILNAQLCPKESRNSVLDFTAGASALGVDSIKDADKRGDAATKRTGEIGYAFGFTWNEDDHILTHTRNGLGAGALTVNGVNPVDAEVISIAKGAGDSWYAFEGDLLTFAGDTQQYVITADLWVGQAANTDVPISPPLKVATVGGEAVTSIDTHVVNLAFHPNGIAVAMRPILDAQGELSAKADFAMMRDPATGLMLRIEVIRAWRQWIWAIDVLYGTKLIDPRLVCRILG